MEAVGRELRRARGEEKQQAIADRADISDTTLSRLEKGQRPEGIAILLRVLDALGLELRFARRAGTLVGQDPEVVVEDALKADPQLHEYTREVLMAAYRRARLGTPDARPKARAAGASR